LDSKIHNWKKLFWIHQSIIKIRLPDSTIQKSTIYANFVFRTHPHPESNMFHFRIDESVVYSQIPISNKRWGSVSRFIKLWWCRKKNLGVQEETAIFYHPILCNHRIISSMGLILLLTTSTSIFPHLNSVSFFLHFHMFFSYLHKFLYFQKCPYDILD